jgi:adenine-specific DNA methylase
MAADTKKVFQLVCPCCGATIWVDSETRDVLQTERAKKKKGSLDDLVSKELKRAGDMGRKFDATFELQAEKKQKADDAFRKALEKAEQEGPEEPEER